MSVKDALEMAKKNKVEISRFQVYRRAGVVATFFDPRN